MKPIDPIFTPLLDHAAAVTMELDLRAALERLPAEIQRAAEVVKAHPGDEAACRRWAELCELQYKAERALKKCSIRNNL